MRQLPIILFGIGGVGQSLVQQILDNRAFHAEQYGLVLKLIALCDSGGILGQAGIALDDTRVREALALKASNGRLQNHAHGHLLTNPMDVVTEMTTPGTVVVDCTASDTTIPALLHALEAQASKVVLANKKPLTVQQEVYDRLTRAGGTDSSRHLGRTRWETTVGAGLPVIAMLNRLVASGDQVHHIAGTFSGTLGYVMTGLQEGKQFSDIVRKAHQLGYTEPDPRDDLGGVDVARKALILARGLGWQLEMSDLSIEGLYPAEMDDLSVDEFLDALPTLDQRFQDQVETAATQGKVLRYAANVENSQCVVGPTIVDSDSPLGRLNGTDNLVEFHSRWYTPNPLVILGRGAGVEATAAGVLSDIIELAYSS